MIGMHHGGRKKGHPVAETLGWVGTVAVLLAYVMALFGVISANGFWYALLNLVGSIGIIVIAVNKKLVQSVVLNVVWGLIALAAIVGLWLR